MALKRRFQRKQTDPNEPESNASGPQKGLRIVVDNESYIPGDPSSVPAGTNPQNPQNNPPILESDLQRRMSTYRRINDLYQEKGIDLPKLLKGFLDIIVRALDAEGGSLWLLDPDTHQIECKGALGTGSKEIIGFTLPFGKGIVGWVIQKNASTLVSDTTTDERFSAKGDQKTGSTTKTLMATPLCYAGHVLGAVEVINKKNQDEKFTDSDKIFLEDICTPAAMHIQTTISRKRQDDLLKRMQTFSEMQTLFAGTLEIDKLLSIVLTRAISLLSAEVGSIWLLDETGERIICHVAEGPTKAKVIGMKLNRGAGIIGNVVDTQKPTIVEDCSKDTRFSSEVDKKTGFTTRSMMTVPLSNQSECLGAIQIINKNGEHLLFSKEDMDLLMLFASSSALYIKNARLFASHKKAKELSALIGISKEITATLDLDAVLMSIVNLSSDVIPYDNAVISIERSNGKGYEVRGVNGIEKVDPTDENTKTLEKLHNSILEIGKEILIENRDEYTKSKDAHPKIKEYLEKKNLQSFWANLLKDDQGPLGILSMESAAKNMIPSSKRELLSLLVSQSTVALRNAQLYQTIPTGNIFSNYKEKLFKKINQIKEWPKEKQQKLALSVLGVIFSLIFVKVPYNVATNIEVVPITMTYYSHSQGTVDKVLVQEGQTVKTDNILIQLDPTDLLIEKKKKESQREKVTSEMIKLQGEDKIAESKIKEKEKFSLDGEIELLEHQLTNTDIKSTVDGVVVSDKLHELIGKPVSFGQELIKVAKLDEVSVHFQVPEDEILFIQTGQKVKFKVFGLPNQSFSKDLSLKTVAGEGKGLTEKDTARFFIARTDVPHPFTKGAILRPGMTGRGKIYAKWQPLGYFLFQKPFKFFMMKLWF